MIPKLVVDLDRFDVARHDTTVLVTRPSLTAEPDFEPTRDDHIPCPDDDARERASMDAYYRSKSRRLGKLYSQAHDDSSE